MREDIYNDKNFKIGWIEGSPGSDRRAMHMRKGYIGRYVKASNLTFDGSGRVYCYGDGCQSLIRDVERGYL